MKKTFVKLGLLALALAFTLVSCAQPTEEAGGGTKAPTIIRLYLDRDDVTLVAGTDSIQIRVGEELYGYGNGNGNFPYASNADSVGGVENANRTNADPMTAANRKQVTSIPVGRAYNADEILQDNDPKRKYLVSGVKTIVNGVVDPDALANGVSKQVDAKGIYYVDIPLVNRTVGSKDRGSIYAGSINGWVELRVNGTADVIHDKALLYTKDKHGFNDLWKMDNGVAIYKTTNSNIKKFSLKPGINELYLSYFSNAQYGN